MIKIILCGAFALFASLCHAQVYKFKAFETYLDRSKGKVSIEEADYHQVDLLVVINMDKNKICTYGDKPYQFDIVKLSNAFKNDNGDDVLPYKAVDNDGDECDINVVFFQNREAKHIATMVISYEHFDVYFRLKKDD